MKQATAVLDACVLYPASLRDVLMTLADQGLYQPKWTDRIHEEWMSNLLADHPGIAKEKLERTRTLMNQHGGDWQVPPFEHLIPMLSLPDPDDRHVLAAAIASAADCIVTLNLRHFPANLLDRHGLKALHPDAFVCSLYDVSADAVVSATRRHRAELVNPPRTVDEHLVKLRRAGLTQFAARLEPRRADL